jgi:ABC-type multidrug transport system fused ATPase/permease subunit
MRFVSTLPNGFDTPLLPEGKTLPRNIITKIILARSIVSKPKLLAIEELMANLEHADRIRIANILTDKDSNWTLVAVTDDPELAIRCDRILVMKGGEIIQEGTFEEIKRTPHFDKIFKVYHDNHES